MWDSPEIPGIATTPSPLGNEIYHMGFGDLNLNTTGRH